MAGSYRHLVNADGTEYIEPGGEEMDFPLIENMGDAREAMAEMLDMIWHLAGGDQMRIFQARALASRLVHESNRDTSDKAYAEYWSR